MQRRIIGNIKGPQGAQGLQGPQGVQGLPGAKGDRGSKWFEGTGIIGTSVEEEIYIDSGVTEAKVDDCYLNVETGYVYVCRVPGSASEAKWVYVGSIRGPQPQLVNSLDSDSTTKALTAAKGKELNEKFDAIGLYPMEVRPKSEKVSYTGQLIIENESTTLSFYDDDNNVGTYEYTKAGDAVTAIINVTIGSSIGLQGSGAVIVKINSSAAAIHSYTLYDNSQVENYSETPSLWKSINANDESVRAGGTITETHDGDTYSYRDGIISRVIDGVKTLLYPITHAKATWFNKAANRTVFDTVTDLADTSEFFSTAESYVANDYVFYESALYRFKKAHTGTWNANDAEKVSLKSLKTEVMRKQGIELSEPIGTATTVEGCLKSTSDRVNKNNIGIPVYLNDSYSRNNPYVTPSDGYVTVRATIGTGGGVYEAEAYIYGNSGPANAIDLKATEDGDARTLFVKKGMKIVFESGYMRGVFFQPIE